MLKHLWWLALALATALLVAHTFQIKVILVDSTSLILLGFILVSPFAAAIKRIKVGDWFEAEIDPAEVNKVAAEAEKAIAESPQRTEGMAESFETAQAIRRLAETDLVVALAKLRIELESRLRKLYERTRNVEGDRSRRGISQLVRDLTVDGTMPFEMAAATRDVTAICNRVIHGEDIREEDGRRIVEVGSVLLEELELIVRQYAVMHPISKEVISSREVEDALAARYRITTITPYVDHPERRTYEMSQEELNDYFDGYSEFAEFVVRIEKI